MHYFLGVLILLVLAIALPPVMSMAIIVFFTISALIVKVSGSLVTKSDISFSNSMKAVIYSLFFTLLAGVVATQLGGVMGGGVVFVFPMLVFLAQTIAYSMALEVPLFGSALISICVMIVGWIIQIVFGISASTTLNIMS